MTVITHHFFLIFMLCIFLVSGCCCASCQLLLLGLLPTILAWEAVEDLDTELDPQDKHKYVAAAAFCEK